MSVLLTMIVCTSAGWAAGRAADRPGLFGDRWRSATLAARVAWLRMRARRYTEQDATIIRLRAKERL